MYFKTYAPATLSENCETARAFHQYNAVCRASGKNKPRFNDYLEYIGIPLELTIAKILEEEGWEANYNTYIEELRMTWEGIKEAIRNAGQPLRGQYVAYFALLENGMKSGETKDIIQRYGNINRATPIRKMWYINVESKEQAKAAEHALHMIFDHARCMNRQQNKKDYYECDPESAEKFLAANMKKIFEIIVAEVAKAGE